MTSLFDWADASAAAKLLAARRADLKSQRDRTTVALRACIKAGAVAHLGWRH